MNSTSRRLAVPQVHERVGGARRHVWLEGKLGVGPLFMKASPSLQEGTLRSVIGTVARTRKLCTSSCCEVMSDMSDSLAEYVPHSPSAHKVMSPSSYCNCSEAEDEI